MRTRTPKGPCSTEGCHRARTRYVDKCDHCYAQQRIKKAKLDGSRQKHIRTAHLLRKYNITPEEFDAMLSMQENKCALCGDLMNRDWPSNGSSAVIDHCHETNKVRAVIHSRCNIAIGHLLDSPERCLLAYAYLAKHK